MIPISDCHQFRAGWGHRSLRGEKVYAAGPAHPKSAVTKSKGKGAGEFTLEGVLAGDRTVTASLNGYVTQSKTVTLAVGQTWVVDFQLVLISTSSFRKVDIDTQGPGHISLASFSSPGSISRLRNVNWIVKSRKCSTLTENVGSGFRMVPLVRHSYEACKPWSLPV